MEKVADIAVADPSTPKGAPPWLVRRANAYAAALREHMNWTGFYQAERLVGWDQATSAARAQMVAEMQSRGMERMITLSVVVSPDPGVALAKQVVYDVREGGIIAHLSGPVRLPPGSARHGAGRWVNDMLRVDTGRPGVAASRLLLSVQVKPGIKEIGLIDVDGRNMALVTQTGGLNLDPAWGPGGTIGYMSYRKGNADWMVDGRPLSQRPGMNAVGAWSPSGKQLALTVSAGAHTDILVVDGSSGKEVARVTAHSSVNTSPTWAPEGKRLAFVSDRSGGPNVWIADLATGRAKRLTAGYCGSPDWSPLGETIVYAQMVSGGKFVIMRHDFDTGRTVRLTPLEVSSESPVFSPHGRYIAFIRVRPEDRHRELWLMDADGRRMRHIGPDRFPIFSPAWDKVRASSTPASAPGAPRK